MQRFMQHSCKLKCNGVFCDLQKREPQTSGAKSFIMCSYFGCIYSNTIRWVQSSTCQVYTTVSPLFVLVSNYCYNQHSLRPGNYCFPRSDHFFEGDPCLVASSSIARILRSQLLFATGDVNGCNAAVKHCFGNTMES